MYRPNETCPTAIKHRHRESRNLKDQECQNSSKQGTPRQERNNIFRWNNKHLRWYGQAPNDKPVEYRHISDPDDEQQIADKGDGKHFA